VFSSKPKFCAQVLIKNPGTFAPGFLFVDSSDEMSGRDPIIDVTAILSGFDFS